MKFPVYRMRLGKCFLMILAAGLMLCSRPAPGQVAEAWVRHYGGTQPSEIHIKKLVVDNQGNVIGAGHGDVDGNGRDMLVLKYSESGVPLWTNRYNGAVSGDDIANDVAVDQAGAIIVTGHSTGLAGNTDYLTIKYSAAGVALWTNRYDGTDHFYDMAMAVAVDTNGNVFVTGEADDNIATIAYSSGGLPLWTNHYSVPSHNVDRGNDVTVDAGGNVIVTGWSSHPFINAYDYTTIKYSNSGATIWANVDQQPGTSDYAYAVAVTTNGNVHVTGSAGTVAYSASGALLWRHPAPGSSIVADKEGNLLTINGSGTYRTTKISPAGIGVWTNYHIGSGTGLEIPHAVAVDGNGTVFVTGELSTDYATVAYSSGGNALWTNRYDYPDSWSSYALTVAVNTNGNVFVAGMSADGAVLGYSGAGVGLWTNHNHDTSYTYDQAVGVAVTTNGNIVVLGQEKLIAYSGNGVALWTNDLVFGAAQTIGHDVAGNIFVTRDSLAFGGSGLTLAYANTGIPLWSNYFYGFLADLVVDGEGNVIVTGSGIGSISSGSDFATVKFSNGGIPLWTNYYIGPGPSGANSVAVDPGGNVFVTGNSRGPSFSESEYVTVAYSRNGLPLWTNRYYGATSGEAIATDIAVAAGGNVIVTGQSRGPSGFDDIVTIAYTGAGVGLWTNVYSGLTNYNNLARNVLIGSNGNVFVIGGAYGPLDADLVTIAYSSSGAGLWTNRFAGPGGGSLEGPLDSILDGNGDVIVTGFMSSDGGFSADGVTLKYSSTGILKWAKFYKGTIGGDGFEVGVSLAVTADNSIIVVGHSDANNLFTETYDIFTIKYVDALTIETLTNQVVLKWPQEDAQLQAAPAVTGVYTNIPGAVSPHVYPITGSAMYFRLKPN